VVAGGPGTHPGGRVPDPPGWVRYPRVPATPDPFRTADPKGSYSARSVRELRSRIMRARFMILQPLFMNSPPRSESCPGTIRGAARLHRNPVVPGRFRPGQKRWEARHTSSHSPPTAPLPPDALRHQHARSRYRGGFERHFEEDLKDYVARMFA
jgi:hypothetical protein